MLDWEHVRGAALEEPAAQAEYRHTQKNRPKKTSSSAVPSVDDLEQTVHGPHLFEAEDNLSNVYCHE